MLMKVICIMRLGRWIIMRLGEGLLGWSMNFLNMMVGGDRGLGRLDELTKVPIKTDI